MQFNQEIENKKVAYRVITDLFDFILENQLKDVARWNRFVNVYVDKTDSIDCGWRGEYWGKQMRGACNVYEYYQDKELYAILQKTVRDILSTQELSGRISSYEKDNELVGWDMWCRKYVLVGLLHFYGICKETELKERVYNAMKASVDYILENVGESKKHIFETSNVYGGVNSCSILEPIVELYKLTAEKRYLDFAEYIIQTGGCKDGNLFDCVKQKDCYPYQYPETKIYETMSFFEGCLAYAEVTGNEEYADLVVRFVNDIIESDTTILGGCGCSCEHFDNSTVNQTLETGYLAQETCVTVTWLRLLSRVYKMTGNVTYQDLIEKIYYNAYLGSINENRRDVYCVGIEKYIKNLPFYCYSPLLDDVRTRHVSGCKDLGEDYYSCCSAIGATGLTVLPKNAFLVCDKTVVLNHYINGKKEILYGDNKITIAVATEYPVKGIVKLTFTMERPERFMLKLRIPKYSANSFVDIGSERISCETGYYETERVWKNGDVIMLDFSIALKPIFARDKVAFEYGALVLAKDEEKNAFDFIPEEYMVEELLPLNKELCRIALKAENGQHCILTDYASCGKKTSSKISVWMKRRTVK